MVPQVIGRVHTPMMNRSDDSSSVAELVHLTLAWVRWAWVPTLESAFLDGKVEPLLAIVSTPHFAGTGELVFAVIFEL